MRRPLHVGQFGTAAANREPAGLRAGTAFPETRRAESRCSSSRCRPDPATLNSSTIARQVLVLRAQPVSDPRPHARLAAQHHARIHLERGGRVVAAVADHAFDHAQVVGVPGRVRQQVGHPQPALAMLLPLPRPAHQLVLAGVEDAAHLIRFFETVWNRLAVQLFQQRFVIEQVHRTRPAIHKQKNDVFGFGREVGRTRGKRTRRINHNARSVFCPGLLGEQGAQGQTAKSRPRPRQKFAAAGGGRVAGTAGNVVVRHTDLLDYKHASESTFKTDCRQPVSTSRFLGPCPRSSGGCSGCAC